MHSMSTSSKLRNSLIAYATYHTIDYRLPKALGYVRKKKWEISVWKTLEKYVLTLPLLTCKTQAVRYPEIFHQLGPESTHYLSKCFDCIKPWLASHRRYQSLTRCITQRCTTSPWHFPPSPFSTQLQRNAPNSCHTKQKSIGGAVLTPYHTARPDDENLSAARSIWNEQHVLQIQTMVHIAIAASTIFPNHLPCHSLWKLQSVRRF